MPQGKGFLGEALCKKQKGEDMGWVDITGIHQGAGDASFT